MKIFENAMMWSIPRIFQVLCSQCAVPLNCWPKKTKQKTRKNFPQTLSLFHIPSLSTPERDLRQGCMRMSAMLLCAHFVQCACWCGNVSRAQCNWLHDACWTLYRLCNFWAWTFSWTTRRQVLAQDRQCCICLHSCSPHSVSCNVKIRTFVRNPHPTWRPFSTSNLTAPSGLQTFITPKANYPSTHLPSPQTFYFLPSLTTASTHLTLSTRTNLSSAQMHMS